MTFDYAQVDRIAQVVDRAGEDALCDVDREIYEAWTAYVEEAAPKIAPKLALVLGVGIDHPPTLDIFRASFCRGGAIRTPA